MGFAAELLAYTLPAELLAQLALAARPGKRCEWKQTYRDLTWSMNIYMNIYILRYHNICLYMIVICLIIQQCVYMKYAYMYIYNIMCIYIIYYIYNIIYKIYIYNIIYIYTCHILQLYDMEPKNENKNKKNSFFCCGTFWRIFFGESRVPAVASAHPSFFALLQMDKEIWLWTMKNHENYRYII